MSSDQQAIPTEESKPENSISDDRKVLISFVSLLNFDPESRERDFINSPRSLEAMRRLCYTEADLLKKHIEDFINDPVPNEFADDANYYFEVKVEHYEKRRQEKLKALIKERNNIIKEKEMGGSAFGNVLKSNLPNKQISRNHTEADYTNSIGSKSQLDDEFKKIQQMKNKQQKEIDLIIQAEVRVQEMQKKQDEKNKKLEEIEKKRQEDLVKKHEDYEEARRKREQLEKEKELKDLELKKLLIEKHRLEELKIKERTERLAQDREKQAMEKELLRRQKAMTREEKFKEIEKENKRLAIERSREREEKAERLRIELERRRQEKIFENDLSKKEFEEKIAKVKESQVQVTKEIKQKFIVKQSATQEKRIRVEEAKKQELDERRRKTEIKTQEIKTILNAKFAEEQAKKKELLQRFTIAEENKKKRDMDIEFQRREKILKEQEKERQTKEVIQQYESEKKRKADDLLKNLAVNMTEAEKRRQENIKNLKKKYIIEILHAEDVMENNARLAEMDRQKKKQVFERIQVEQERLAQIRREKEIAYLEKKKLQEQLQQEKEAILKEFELKKKRLARDRNSGNISLRDDFNISPKFSLNNKFQSGRLSPLEHTQSVNTSNFNNPSTPNLMYMKKDNPYELSNSRAQSGPIANEKDEFTKLVDENKLSQRSGQSNLKLKEPISSLPLESKFFGSPYTKKLPDRRLAPSTTKSQSALSNIPDMIPSEYSKESGKLRNKHNQELAKVLQPDEGGQENKNLFDLMKKQQEEISQLRIANNFLFFKSE